MKALRLLNHLRPSAVQLVLVAVVLVVAVTAYNLGARTGSQTGEQAGERASAPSAVSEAPVIWTCSMHPQIRQDHPGQCPICGMDLIPEEAPAATATQPVAAVSEPAGWACAMNCLPPLPNPGKCPICGMEMVPVGEPEMGGASASPRQLSMSEEARALAAIRTAPVERLFVTNLVHMVGTIDYDESRIAELATYVDGRLDRLYVDYTGVPVRKGDHLVYLYSPALLTTQEDLRLAKQSLEQLSAGASAGLRESRRRQMESIRERLRLWGLLPAQIQAIEESGTTVDHVTIYSPMSGIVIRKNKQQGDSVMAGESIYTIADLNRLWVRLKAYESDLPWIRFGQDISFTTESHPGEIFHGRIAFIQPTVDPQTRTVDVRVNVNNEDGRLKPGMFVRARVESRLAQGGRVIEAELAGKWISPMHPEIIKDRPGQCDVCGMDLVRAEELGFVAADAGGEPPLTVPASAPLITGKRAIVYVEIPGAERPTYDGREILLGPKAGDHYLVREGLAEGERVVVNGAFKIDSALQIQARPSMMNPPAAAAGAVAGAVAGHAGHGAVMPAVSSPATPAAAAEEAGTGPFPVSAAFRESLAPLYRGYFNIAASLAADDLAASRSAYAALQEAVAGLNLDTLEGRVHETCNLHARDLRIAAVVGRDAEDLQEAREAFEELSVAILAMEAAFGHAGTETHYRIRCPMAFNNKGAEWLQNEKDVLNPYFGASMLKCGSVIQTYAAVSANTSTGGQHDPSASHPAHSH